MRWPTIPILFLGVSFFLPLPPARAQSDPHAEVRRAPVSHPATEEEVTQLRQEVAELRMLVQRLTETGSQAANDGPRLALASTVLDSALPDADLASPASHSVMEASSELTPSPQQQTGATPPIVAGWNGEHFFLKSSDGNFIAMPIGYFNAQYNFYKGDGAPPATFTIPRARFGLQGSYGKQLDYQFLFESASPLTIRDAYLDFKPSTSFSIMGGQYRTTVAVGILRKTVLAADRSVGWLRSTISRRARSTGTSATQAARRLACWVRYWGAHCERQDARAATRTRQSLTAGSTANRAIAGPAIRE